MCGSTHITALEDAHIREMALGGPDTATRTQTLWQVKLLRPVPDPAPLTCASEPKSGRTCSIRPRTASSARGPQRARTPQGPCVVPSGAGYRRLENQLYRVEIHEVDSRGAIKLLKWSRDNGSIVTRWLDQKASKPEELIVASIGREDVLRFGPGQYVEVIDDARELRGEAGILVKLANAEGQVLTLDTTDLNEATVLKADFPDKINGRSNNPKVRRWDGVLEKPATDNWLELEDGVQVKFEAEKKYHVGDYWLIPARTATADVEWPRDDLTPPNPIPQPRAGIEHHYCKLAILQYKEIQPKKKGFTVLQDCREIFPPLTEMVTLLYVGGDGQEAMPGHELQTPLQVGVANGQWPARGARVRFSIQPTTGNGKLQDKGSAVDPASPAPTDQTRSVLTDLDGIAKCGWQLDANTGKLSQQVRAELLNAADKPVYLPIIFTANLSLASQVAYTPGDCKNLAEDVTVQKAIGKLAGLIRLHPMGGTARPPRQMRYWRCPSESS